MARKTMTQKSLRRKVEAPRAAAKDVKSKKAKPEKPEKSAKAAKDGKSVKDAKPKDGKSKDVKKDAKRPAKEAAPAKEAPPKKKRSKSGVVRLKAFWGVFNPMMKRVAVFEYAERKQADKKAAELTANSKASHFVQLVKEVIRDAE
jgi:hypothetical protein